MSENLLAADARCIDRRRFLVLGGATVSVVGLLASGNRAVGQVAQLVMSTYPEKRVLRMSDVKPKTPVEFTYPSEDVGNLLIKLGERAGGGVGPDDDIVAFNAVCPHMGGPLGPDTYVSEHNVLGPCPLHLTTFDLTRHGMVVSGHATEGLPQIVLEIRNGDILAVGVMGLLYGYHENPRGA